VKPGDWRSISCGLPVTWVIPGSALSLRIVFRGSRTVYTLISTRDCEPTIALYLQKLDE